MKRYINKVVSNRSMMKTTSLRIPEDLWKRVRHYCVDNDMEYTQFLKEALEEALTKHEAK